MRLIVAVTLVLGAVAAAVGIATAQSAYDPTAYTYSLTVNIENESSTPWTGPVPVAMNTNALVSGGYASSTGLDVLFTDSAHNRAGGFAQDMDSSAASTWFWFADVPANTTVDVKAFMDGPAVPALFPLDGSSDRIEVSDDSSLDITDDLTLEATVMLHSLPDTASTATIVGKYRAYELFVRNGDEAVGAVYKCCATATLRPNSATQTTNLWTSGCTTNYQCVDEAVHDSDTTYITNFVYSPVSDRYALRNRVPAAVPIVAVRAFHVTKGGSNALAGVGLVLGTNLAQGTLITPASSYTRYNSTFSTSRPGGGSWTAADFRNLQIELTLDSHPRTTQVYVEVDYAARTEATYSPMSAGQPYDLKLTYDSPDLKLYVDGVERDSASQSGTLDNSNYPVKIGNGVTGGVGGVRIGHTSSTAPTYALDLKLAGGDIEPTQVGSASNSWEWRGTVDDRSAADNDGTYYITSDPGDLTITVNGLEVQPEALPSLPDQPVAAVAPNPPLAVFVTPQAGGIISSPFMDPYRELVNSSALPAHAFWMILSTVVAAVVSGKVLQSRLRSMLWAAVAGGLVYFVLAYILGVPLAFVVFVGLGYFAAIGPVKFMR